MEEAALNLERAWRRRRARRYSDAALGEAPSVSTFDKIDRAWNKTQRSNVAAHWRVFLLSHEPCGRSLQGRC